MQDSFKVYTAGFYLHQLSYPGSYPEEFLELIGQLTSAYYVFIARGIAPNGDIEEWYVDLKLPEVGVFNCLSASDRLQLTNLLKVTSNNYSLDPVGVSMGIANALDKLEYYVNVIVNCECNYVNPSCAKSQFEKSDDYLLGMGFKKKKVSIGSARSWVNGTAGIYDHTSNSFSLYIDGREYYIPDEVYLAKVILDNGNFVEENDTFSVDFKGRVYLFDSGSFRGGSNEQAWIDAVDISSSEDYVEYWVILQDDVTKSWYLYSRFTLGPLEPPVTAIQGDDGEEARSVSPLSLLLKFTVNAVIDIMIESTVNHLFDKNITSWEQAFKSVNYARVAADALFSLIPWENSASKYEILGRTLIGAVGRVLENSKSNSGYTAKDGFEDFLVGAGTGALGHIVGQKVQQVGATSLFPGLMKIVQFANSQKIKSIFARCFSTNLINYGCFTGNVGVYRDHHAQSKISALALHDVIISKRESDAIVTSNSYDQDFACHLNIHSSDGYKRYAVAFQSLDEKHRYQLSLDDDVLSQYGVHEVGDWVRLSIPDQGMEDVYVVMDIKRIKPPKIPSDGADSGDLVYSWITGIHEHASDDVWRLIFEKGDELEVTGSHPFFDAGASTWTPASWLEPGDVLQTKDGTATLLAREKREGEHQVYNITVAGTHTYFVGDGGLWVHNSCGSIVELDQLATKFINNLNATIKKSEIAEWWAKGYPKFFQRGTFFERLMAKSGRYSGWTVTPSNWPVIDFQKIIGGNVMVVSMKTTITTDVTTWMSTNVDHLVKLNNMLPKWAKNSGGLPEIRALHIYVKDSELTQYSNWAASIKTKYPNIKEVIVSSIETEFSL